MRLSLNLGVAALLVLGTSGLAGVAQADGEAPRPRRAPVAAPAAEPVQTQQRVNWTGGQFGGHGGGSQLGQSFAEPGSNLCPASGGISPGGVSVDYQGCRENHFAFSGHPSSVTLGASLGYRVQMGNFVVGVEGDASWKNASTSSSYRVVSPVFDFGGTTPHTKTETFSGKTSQGSDGSIRARAGVLVTPWMLAYATGGLAVGQVCGNYSYAATLVHGAGPIQTTGSAYGAASWCDARYGYTAGGGIEVEVFRGWKAKLEYRFTDLGDYTKNIPLTATRAVGGCAAGYNCYGNARVDVTDNSFQTIRLGIAYDF